jgi:hypothetical protein
MNKNSLLLLVILITSLCVIDVSANTLWALVNFGPTVVTEEPLDPFSPVLTTNYDLSSVYVGETHSFTVTLTNPSTCEPSSGNVLVDFVITKDSTAFALDVILEYFDVTWHVIPLIVSGNTLTGVFGPPVVGFPVSTGYSVTTQLRVTYNAIGTYSGVANLVSVV